MIGINVNLEGINIPINNIQVNVTTSEKNNPEQKKVITDLENKIEELDKQNNGKDLKIKILEDEIKSKDLTISTLEEQLRLMKDKIVSIINEQAENQDSSTVINKYDKEMTDVTILFESKYENKHDYDILNILLENKDSLPSESLENIKIDILVGDTEEPSNKVNLLIEETKKEFDSKQSQDILKELFHNDQNKSYIDRLEKLAKEYASTHSENYLAEIKDIVLKKDTSNQELEIYDGISNTLWEALMCLAFEFLENNDIKSHHILTNILYFSIKNKGNINKNLGIAKFHYAISMKDYCNNFSLALNLFLESIQLIEKVGEGDTKLGVQVKYYLGNLYDDMGMSDESINLLRDVLEKQIKLFTEQHIYTARTYNCLGIAEDNRGNLRQAKDYYQKAYGIFKFLSFGLETIDSVKVLNNLAGIYYKWEEYSKCISYYSTVLKVYNNKSNEKNSNMAITYNNLSNCYSMLDNNEKALFYLKQAVDIFNSVLGSSHIQTAMANKNLGDLYHNMDDKKNALDMFIKCVDIFLEKYGEDNDLYISTLSKIKKIKNQNYILN